MIDTAPPLDAGWHVVRNDAGSYSVWPGNRDVPVGWHHVGTNDTQAEALTAVAAGWVDARPAAVGSSA